MSDRKGEIRARLAAAHPAPWSASGKDAIASANGRLVACVSSSAKCPRAGDYYECEGPEVSARLFMPDAERALIIEAPADLAWLVGEVEREKARADAAEAALATADAAGFARAREDAAKLVERYFNLTGQIVSGTWFDKCKPAARDCAAAIRALLPRVPS